MHLTSPNAAPEGEVNLRAATLRELERLLTSEGFAKAERMRRFLTYAVERTLDGDLGQLKESVIGVEVFDRSPSYDPKSDPIVRIEARRLRDKLSQYYQADGKDNPVRISLPKGGYVISVELLAPAEPEPEPPPELPQIVEAPVAPAVETETLQVLPARRRGRWLIPVGIAALLLLVGGVGGAWYWWTHDHPTEPLAPHVFTTLPGAESEPAISRDGSKVVFVWTNADTGKRNIYIQAVGNFVPTLASPEAEGDISSPVWSPSGKEIAYLRPTRLNRMASSPWTWPPVASPSAAKWMPRRHPSDRPSTWTGLRTAATLSPPTAITW